MAEQATSSNISSRDKLIYSAERLFAERGYDRVSVRDIANDAKVNSALVGYYFGGKQGLLTEVYTRHCEPLKRERARILVHYSENGRKPTLEEILDAFIRPSLQASQSSPQGRSFSRLRAILSAENSTLLEQLVAQNFDQSTRAFAEAICKCLTHLTREDVFWRLHFLLGAIYYTAAGPHRIKRLSNGKCDPGDPIPTTDELIRYAAAGFRAEGNSDRRKKSSRTRRDTSPQLARTTASTRSSTKGRTLSKPASPTRSSTARRLSPSTPRLKKPSPQGERTSSALV